MDLVIRNCKFIYECPQTWDALQPTDKQNVRQCRVCNKEVFLCDTGRQLQDALFFDRCVAVAGKKPGKPGRQEREMLLGIPDSKYISYEYRDDLE